MLIDDSLLYVLTFAFSAFFTALTFLPSEDDFEEQLSEQGFNVGMLPAIIRISFFPLVSSIGWGIMSIFSLTLNNCSQTFNECYTNPLLNIVGPSVANPFGIGLAIVFMLLATMMIVMSAVIIFSISGAILTATRNKRHG